MTTKHINALRRFAAGKRINCTMRNLLIDYGYLARDEYGSVVITRRGESLLRRTEA